MKELIKTLLNEAINNCTIKCEECSWEWKVSESELSDLYICHKCGHDNE